MADQIEEKNINISIETVALTTKGYNLGFRLIKSLSPDIKELEQKSLSFVCDSSLDSFPIEFFLPRRAYL